MLVDYGLFSRLGTTPAILAAKGQQLGYHWRYDDLKEFKLGALSPYQLITKAISIYRIVTIVIKPRQSMQVLFMRYN